MIFAVASMWYFQVRFLIYQPTHQDWHSDKMFVFDELLLLWHKKEALSDLRKKVKIYYVSVFTINTCLKYIIFYYLGWA